MTWKNDRAAREHTASTYGADWRRQRQKALARAGHRCEQCSSARDIQVDHVVPVSHGGSHQLTNLQVLCGGCHRKKTATEGGGWRNRGRRREPDAQPRTLW